MRWFYRSLLILGFVGLGLLAVWPHIPKIETELNLLLRAWKQVRAEQPIAPESEATAQASETTDPSATKATRIREIATPLPSAEIDSPIDESESDPFLMEARQRAEEDPEAAMQWLQAQSSGTERLRGMLEVVALWAAEDSESALLWLESNAQGLARLETLNSGVELWAESDPTAAASWIDGMANDGSKITAAKSLAAKWVQSSPEAAVEWITGLPNNTVREEATRALAEAWVQEAPEAASIWAVQEAEFNGNYELLSETIREFSKQSAQAAEDFVRSMRQTDYSEIALAAHIQGRAEQDPEATANWLTSLTPDDPIESSKYAKNLMQVWAANDSIAASEWLSQMPQGAQRDAAVIGFSESIQRFEPEAAVAWANTIADPKQRLDQLKQNVQSWAKSQPAAALEWVQNAELAPSLREQLAREIPWD